MKKQYQFYSPDEWSKENRKAFKRDALVHLAIIVVVIMAVCLIVKYGAVIDSVLN